MNVTIRSVNGELYFALSFLVFPYVSHIPIHVRWFSEWKCNFQVPISKSSFHSKLVENYVRKADQNPSITEQSSAVRLIEFKCKGIMPYYLNFNQFDLIRSSMHSFDQVAYNNL
jgi:hypothetical protein